MGRGYFKAAIGARATTSANVADNNPIGGQEIIHIIDVPDAATANVDVTVVHKFEVMSMVVVKKAGAGGASDTIQLKNGTSAISNAISINVADQTVISPGTLDDSQTVIAAGGTLRAACTKASGAN